MVPAQPLSRNFGTIPRHRRCLDGASNFGEGENPQQSESSTSPVIPLWMAGFLLAAISVKFTCRRTALAAACADGTGAGSQPERPYRYRRRRALVRAAFLAAAERLAEPLVRDAFLAAAERAEALRCEAARRACFDSEERETVLRGSRLRTCDTARETRGRRFGFRLPWPAS